MKNQKNNKYIKNQNSWYDYDEEKKEKTNGKVKWVVIIIVLAMTILTSIGIAMFVNSPKYAVMQTLNNLKKGNLEEVNKYLNYKSLINCLDDKIETNQGMSEFEKECFSNLSYTINSETVENNRENATVEVEITNKNFRNILSNWAKEVFKKQINGVEISDADSKEILNQYLKDTSIGTITVTKTVNLQKINKKWQIEVNENFENAIFPGLKEVVDSVDSLIEK